MRETPQDNEERDARLARDRAEKRLAVLTKEVDWRVAKAYVALADDPDEAAEYEAKSKEAGGPSMHRPAGHAALHVAAMNKYLDDDEWEQEERRQGRTVSIQRFPFFESRNGKVGDEQKNWWTWRK